MLTHATPARTLCSSFAESVGRFGDRLALSSADGEVIWTWRDYQRQVREAAACLAGLGVSRGDIVTLWLRNRPEFHAVDAGAMHLGAAAFSGSLALDVGEVMSLRGVE